MKRFPLLPLVAVVFAVACTDSTSPADSHALLSAKNPDLGFLGNPPPPPVDAAINIEITSTPFRAAFNGVYFANGTSVESGIAAQSIGDESLTFTGTAWLRLDNVQPGDFGVSTSANARFQRTDQKLFGMGTLIVGDDTVKIVRVTSFLANPSCGVPGELCADIGFDVTVNGAAGHTGRAQAFDREFCTFVPAGGESDPFYDCGS